MKKLMLLAVAVFALTGLGVATASNGAQVTHFTATYVNGATWTCSGSHIVKSGNGANFIKDSETCVLSGNTAGFLAGTYANGGPCAVAFGPNVGNFPPFGCVIFLSDYNGATATSWTIGVTDNGDGTLTADIVAYY